MARPKKYGLDYFPLDCDFLSDEKMIAVKVYCGAEGVAVAIALLCSIYRNGYYAQWNECTALKIANDLPGIIPDEVAKVVEIMVKYGFFDKEMFDNENVLTSRAIQRRYMTGKRNVKNILELPYWLITDSKAGVSAAKAPENAVEMPSKKSQESTPRYIAVEKTASTTTESNCVSVVEPNTTQIAESKSISVVEPTMTKVSNGASEVEPPVALTGVEAEIKALAEDDLWLDHMQLQVHIDKDSIKALLLEFALHCHTTAKDRHTDIADCKRHFRYWLGRRQYSQTQSPQNNGNSDFKQTNYRSGTYNCYAGNTRRRILRAPDFGLKRD